MMTNSNCMSLFATVVQRVKLLNRRYREGSGLDTTSARGQNSLVLISHSCFNIVNHLEWTIDSSTIYERTDISTAGSLVEDKRWMNYDFN